MDARKLAAGSGTGIVLLVFVCLGMASAHTACFSTHTFGSGRTFMKICISEHGNLVQFESPAGQEHIRVKENAVLGAMPGEGYVVCSASGVHGYDSALAETGFGAATITQPGGPNTFPLTITRDTTDGIFRLTQTFSRDTAEHDVTITMKLKNLSGPAQSAVQLHRYFDGDVGSPSPADGGVNIDLDDIYDRSKDSVWGRETPTDYAWNQWIHGLMLTALSFDTTHFAAVETFSEWNPDGSGAASARGCDHTPAPAPTSPGDYVGRVGYQLGTINALQSKTVKVLYRRF